MKFKPSLILIPVLIGILFFIVVLTKEPQNNAVAICDEYGNRYASEEEAKAKGLSQEQYGATYCPEYLGEIAVTICDEYGNRYASEEEAKAKGLSQEQYGATYCPEYLER